MKKLLFLLIFPSLLIAQINPENIKIARDKWGVPHIMAKTDAEVAYGLAYANAEDDFKTMQQMVLISKGMMGRYVGKNGAAADYVVQLLRCREIVNEKYETDLSIEFKKLIDGYVAGVNAYAAKFPNEVLVKGTFPITKYDYLTSITFSLCVISGADKEITNILKGKTKVLDQFKAQGSNAFAFSSKKTADGKTYLNINPHQPLEGPAAWYEAHLISEEGLNVLGGMFAGSPMVSLGVNENLGWAHTVNYPDRIDTYQLEINPANKNQYKYDGQWINLEEKTIKLKVKVKGIVIPVRKKAYWSVYGATMKTDAGTFAIRLGANQDIRGMEQWYRMCKSNNFIEFYSAMKMVAIPMFNTVYADRNDNIFYVSNAKIPVRAEGYDWRSTLPGNTSKTLTTSFHTLEELPQYLNPESGYLFNCNHSPFIGTVSSENLKSENFDQTMGYETLENNRSRRFQELISEHDKIDYADFKKIKYDNSLPKNLKFSINIDTVFLLNPEKYPEIKEEIINIQTWDRKTNIESEGAGSFLIMFFHMRENLNNKKNYLTENEIVEAIIFTKNYKLKYFGKTNVRLGEYQKLVRGDKEFPMWGMPDVLTASHSNPYKDGKVKVEQGESYICLVKFSKIGLPEIETMISYGNSTNPESEHFSDQMEDYIAKIPKRMTLDKKEVLEKAIKIYSPN